MSIQTFSFDSLSDSVKQFSLAGYVHLIEIRVKQYYPGLGVYHDGSWVSKLYVSLGEEREGEIFWNDIQRSFRYPKNQIILPWHERVNRISLSGRNGITGDAVCYLRSEESSEKVILIPDGVSQSLSIPAGSQEITITPQNFGSYTVNGSSFAGVYSRSLITEDKAFVFAANSGQYSIHYLEV
ncbi:MAG: hypothetical protein AAF959_07595 [Cyanobacteria bacterium P01_D01_bin.56]